MDYLYKSFMQRDSLLNINKQLKLNNTLLNVKLDEKNKEIEFKAKKFEEFYALHNDVISDMTIKNKAEIKSNRKKNLAIGGLLGLVLGIVIKSI